MVVNPEEVGLKTFGGLNTRKGYEKVKRGFSESLDGGEISNIRKMESNLRESNL
jgi:hypothetical protein